MRRDADRLRAVRRYVKAPPPALDGPAEQLLAYFGGFFSGEGCFGLSGLVTDPRDPARATSVGEARHAARNAHLQVLRAFAAEGVHDELTATAYTRARETHPDWPHRNTIALAFGGWARALDAAGLGSRVTDWARNRAP